MAQNSSTPYEFRFLLFTYKLWGTYDVFEIMILAPLAASHTKQPKGQGGLLETDFESC